MRFAERFLDAVTVAALVFVLVVVGLIMGDYT